LEQSSHSTFRKTQSKNGRKKLFGAKIKGTFAEAKKQRGDREEYDSRTEMAESTIWA